METEKRYAVIVAVSVYDDDGFSRLPFADNDALRLANILISYGGFDSQNVHLLVDKLGDAGSSMAMCTLPTRANLLQKIKHVADQATEEDLILFFFAGHGVEMSRTPYLITKDTKQDVLQHTAVRVTELNEMLEQSHARCVVRIFDACRSSFGLARGMAGRMTNGMTEALLKPAIGWASISSCSSGEVAYEDASFNQGVFSYYLCEALEGKAVNDGGNITFDGLVDYVKISVGNWCKQQMHSQTPNMQCNLSGSLVLVCHIKSSAAVPIEINAPLGELHARLDRHLAETPCDVRRLTFTDSVEHNKVYEFVQEAVQEHVLDFCYPALQIVQTDITNLSRKVDLWRALMRSVTAMDVKSEFKTNVPAIHLSFQSSEVALPHTSAVIGVVRFSFFYWIWHMHSCSADQLQGSFTANPSFTQGLFTLKPIAALDGAKVADCVGEILKRLTDDIEAWAKQLAIYVDNRLQPLRALDEVIE